MGCQNSVSAVGDSNSHSRYNTRYDESSKARREKRDVNQKKNPPVSSTALPSPTSRRTVNSMPSLSDSASGTTEPLIPTLGLGCPSQSESDSFAASCDLDGEQLATLPAIPESEALPADQDFTSPFSSPRSEGSQLCSPVEHESISPPLQIRVSPTVDEVLSDGTQRDSASTTTTGPQARLVNRRSIHFVLSPEEAKALSPTHSTALARPSKKKPSAAATALMRFLPSSLPPWPVPARPHPFSPEEEDQLIFGNVKLPTAAGEDEDETTPIQATTTTTAHT